MLKCKEFVNSDEIAKGLSPFNSDSIAVAVEASRIMYKRIKELIASGETFAMETTLATRSGANLIREAQREGYYVTLLYFWLNTPDLAVERVKMRVAAGGHNIPESLSLIHILSSRCLCFGCRFLCKARLRAKPVRGHGAGSGNGGLFL